MSQPKSNEELIEGLYNKNPYRYRKMPNGDDGLDNVRAILAQKDAELQKAREASYFKGYNAGLADGTDKPLLAIEQMLQKARQDWLREEIGRLETEQRRHNCPPDDGNDYDHGAWVTLQTIIDRYKEELDQDKK